VACLWRPFRTTRYVKGDITVKYSLYGGVHNKSLELSPKVVFWFKGMSLLGFASR
jgi:hypothetical protein